MSQTTRPESDTPARPQESAPQQAAQEARGRLSNEANPGPPVTDLNGRVCRNQPEAGQIPVLRAGEQNNGCNFQSFDRNSSNSQAMPSFNTADLYRQAQGQTARVRGAGGDGSGVAVARTNDTCYVATAGHMVDTRQGGGPVRSAEFSNGRSYPATLAMRDKPNETAIIAVRTGRDTNQVCNPATFAENPAARGPGMIAGFPDRSNTLHASPGDTTRAGTYRQLNGHAHPSPMPGENTGRQLLGVRAQTHPGNSGGPAYDDQGHVRGLLSGANPARPREEAQVTPISRSQMNQYLNRLGLIR